jgi:hypothetical protein
MEVLNHHIYEYKKGLRNLVLHTMNSRDVSLAEEKLFRQGIMFFVQQVTAQKVNIYFGKEECVKIVRSFGAKSLSELSPEQDFMLGVMLGYDRMQQCERYLNRGAFRAVPLCREKKFLRRI